MAQATCHGKWNHTAETFRLSTDGFYNSMDAFYDYGLKVIKSFMYTYRQADCTSSGFTDSLHVPFNQFFLQCLIVCANLKSGQTRRVQSGVFFIVRDVAYTEVSGKKVTVSSHSAHCRFVEPS